MGKRAGVRAVGWGDGESIVCYHGRRPEAACRPHRSVSFVSWAVRKNSIVEDYHQAPLLSQETKGFLTKIKLSQQK